MTDTGPPTPVDDILVKGQRKPSKSTFSFPMPGPVWPPYAIERDPSLEGRPFNPCLAPRLKREWNMDSAAAAALRELKRFAGDFPIAGPRGMAHREYGVFLWLLPDGSIMMGDMAYGEGTFANSQGTVSPPYWPPLFPAPSSSP